jgi:hypothetical protein
LPKPKFVIDDFLGIFLSPPLPPVEEFGATAEPLLIIAYLFIIKA